ncbi:MAG: tRNA lysidine(34) synthetase TilS [Steroidobacteraceae bacterium]
MAWSGGLDSTVLLHALLPATQRRRPALRLRALHVDHGLQAAAATFRNFCRATARRWRVPLTTITLNMALPHGASVEAEARTARYAALASALRPGELLVTAQHADDQLETLLLALLRGAGPAGLAAMPAAAPFGSSQLLRPLLGHERRDIAAYAAAHALAWVDDPSNAQQRFDRNYLRAAVLPALRARWPAMTTTFSRSARHCAIADATLAQLAQRDLATAADGADLEIAVLRRWTPARQAAVLRAWIAGRGLREPEQRHITQIGQLMQARADAQPQLNLPGLMLRRFDGRLVLEQPAGTTAPRASPAMQRWAWRTGPLEVGNGRLEIRPDVNGDLDLARLGARLDVQFPPAPGGRSLRKLLQELAVPQWQRSRLPLVFARGKNGQRGALLAVADLWLAQAVQCTDASVRRGRIFWRDLS